MNYDEAIAAVMTGAGEPQYAYREAWPENLFIGLNGDTIYLYTSASGGEPTDGEPYSATQQDKEALDWTYDGDVPPR
jgi:hypothetical protein